MPTLKFEILKTNSNRTHLYLFDDKRLYYKHSTSSNGTTYRCKNRKCKSKIIINNNGCRRKNHITHIEEKDNENEYFKLKEQILLETEIECNKNKPITKILKVNNINSTATQHKLYRARRRILSKENAKNSSKKPTNTRNNLKPLRITSKTNTEFTSESHINDVEQESPNQNIQIQFCPKLNYIKENTNYDDKILEASNTETTLEITNNILQSAFNILNEDSNGDLMNAYYNDQQDVTTKTSKYTEHRSNVQSSIKNSTSKMNNLKNNIKRNSSNSVQILSSIIIKKPQTVTTTQNFHAIDNDLHHSISNLQNSIPNNDKLQKFRIETIFIREHMNSYTQNLDAADPLADTKPFNLREQVCVNHLITKNFNCDNCTINEAKITIYNCCHLICIGCWNDHCTRMEENVRKIHKSERIIQKKLKEKFCMVKNCNKSIEKFVHYKN